MSKTPEVTNVTVELGQSSNSRACLSWHADGFRWHVWLDQDGTGAIVGAVGRTRPTLYKSSISKQGEPGYFKPRYLDALTADGNMRPMVDAAFTFMMGHGLLLRARARRQQAADKAMRETETEARERRKRDAGPTLYEALTNVRTVIDDWASDPARAWVFRQVESAIAEAEGRS